MLASEHGAFLQREIDEKHAKKGSKARNSDSDSDDSEPPFGRTIAAKKVSSGKPKKILDALYHVKWWRIVLGMLLASGFVIYLLKSFKTRHITLKTELRRVLWLAVHLRGSSDGASLALLCKPLWAPRSKVTNYVLGKTMSRSSTRFSSF